MKKGKERQLEVRQQRFGGVRKSERKEKKVGRPLKHKGDPTEKHSVTIRQSLMKMKPRQMSRSEFLSNCVTSSHCEKPEKGKLFDGDSVT